MVHGQDGGEVMRRLISIDHKTDSMQDSLAWLVRASSKDLLQELLHEFGTSERRIAVYLALDGKRSVKDLTSLLRMKQPNVSIELAWLRRKRLVDEVEVPGLGKRYAKKFFDAVVALSEALQERLDELQGKARGRAKQARKKVH